jgi:copper(I)-binding protein
VRASNPARKITGAYMELRNHDSVARTLTGANTPLAGVTEIHEMKTQDGMMSMSRVDSVAIPAGATLSLQPGGFHLMLIDLTRDLRTGDVVPMTLQFDNGSTLTLELPVIDAD